MQELVDAARQGRSGVLVVRGDPGIGKTALINEAAKMATDGLVLATVGIEDESDIPYAHLADIFRPVYSEIPRIPSRQAAALSSVFAIGPLESSDQFVVAAGTLSLLSTLAGESPVVVLVDDWQWVDRASRDTLTFVAHRLQAEGIALLIGVREEHAGADRLGRFPALSLGGLDDRSCRELITSVTGPMPEFIVHRLIQGAAGNPLALTDLPALLTPQQIIAWTQGGEPLPIAALLQDAFSESLQELPRSTRSALTLISVLGSTPRRLVDAAFRLARLELDDLGPAEEIGMVVVENGQPGLRHPLIRSAVYQISTSSERRQAHLYAAQALADSSLPNAAERRAGHLIAAGVSADEGLARSLEAAGDHALLARNFAVAGLLFEHSARLTQAAERRVGRLIKAAHGMRLAGSTEEARRLTDQAQTTNGEDPVVAVVLDYLRCRLDIWSGDLVAGRDRLLALVGSDRPIPPELAPYLHADVALASLETGELDIADAASYAAVTSLATGRATPELLTVAVRVFVRALRGDPGALPQLETRAAEVAAFDPLTVDANEQLLLIVGLAHLAAEDVEEAHRVLTRSVVEARAHAALGMLPFRLGRLAWAEFWRGDWAAAAAAAHESLVLVDDTGWQGERPNSLVAAARVEALTGRESLCRQHLAEALAIAEATSARSYTAMAWSVLGSLQFVQGDYAGAIESYTRVQDFADDSGTTNNPLLWWTGDLVECLVLCDRFEEATRVFARLAGATERRPTLMAVTARCRALVDPPRVEEHLAEAQRWHRQTTMPFEEARTALVLGRYLRRQRRPEARSTLTTALVTFERLGAVDWAERTRTELRAAGARPALPAAGLEQLTPQELQVALAVSRGLSNREVAAQLFLSVKTVEYHLSKAFAKLGVSRRMQLAALVTRSRDGRPGRPAGTARQGPAAPTQGRRTRDLPDSPAASAS